MSAHSNCYNSQMSRLLVRIVWNGSRKYQMTFKMWIYFWKCKKNCGCHGKYKSHFNKMKTNKKHIRIKSFQLHNRQIILIWKVAWYHKKNNGFSFDIQEYLISEKKYVTAFFMSMAHDKKHSAWWLSILFSSTETQMNKKSNTSRTI